MVMNAEELKRRTYKTLWLTLLGFFEPWLPLGLQFLDFGLILGVFGLLFGFRGCFGDLDSLFSPLRRRLRLIWTIYKNWGNSGRIGFKLSISRFHFGTGERSVWGYFEEIKFEAGETESFQRHVSFSHDGES